MNKTEEEILDIKKIDSFLIVVNNKSILSNERKSSNTSLFSLNNVSISA